MRYNTPHALHASLESHSHTRLPIIICIGNSGCAMFYNAWAKALAEEYGGRVLIYDRFNIGLSDRVKLDANDFPFWISQIAELMDVLKVPTAHFIGVSLGSEIVTRFAINYPARTGYLAVISPLFGGFKRGSNGDNQGIKLIKMFRCLPPSCRPWAQAKMMLSMGEPTPPNFDPNFDTCCATRSRARLALY